MTDERNYTYEAGGGHNPCQYLQNHPPPSSFPVGCERRVEVERKERVGCLYHDHHRGAPVGIALTGPSGACSPPAVVSLANRSVVVCLVPSVFPGVSVGPGEKDKEENKRNYGIL